MNFSPTLIDRFWRYVDTSAGPDACWPWTGDTQVRRGGQLVGRIFNSKDSHPRVLKAHRVALAIATGEMRDDEDACHRCDNPLCCNARHLHWGSHGENMQEREARHPNHTQRRPDGRYTEE